MSLSLLFDEDSRDNALWNAIQRHNIESPDLAIDAIRVGDESAPGLGTRDPQVLAWAIHAGRIIVSKDVTTMIAVHAEAVDRGRGDTWAPDSSRRD